MELKRGFSIFNSSIL